MPIKAALLSLARSYNGKTESHSYEDMCNDPGLVSEVLKILAAHGKNNGLEKFEIPTKIQLCPEVWLPDSGLVTAAFKLKRRAIQDQFQSSITSINIYARLCALLRRCLSMAKTFFHVFNL